jgi:hypothetical protein
MMLMPRSDACWQCIFEELATMDEVDLAKELRDAYADTDHGRPGSRFAQLKTRHRARIKLARSVCMTQLRCS